MPPDRSVVVEEKGSAVIFGIDSHKSSLAIWGIDELGRSARSASFANTRRGHEALLLWAREHAPEERLFGIEGAGKYAYALTRLLLAAGEQVVEVPAKLTDRERLRLRGAGKSDERDALAIARFTARDQDRFARLGGESELPLWPLSVWMSRPTMTFQTRAIGQALGGEPLDQPVLGPWP